MYVCVCERERVFACVLYICSVGYVCIMVCECFYVFICPEVVLCVYVCICEREFLHVYCL